MAHTKATARQLAIAITACAVMLTPQSVAQDASRHAYLPVAVTKNEIAYLDTKTLAQNGNIVTAWTIWVTYPPQKMSVGVVSYTISEDDYDCQARTSIAKDVVEYDTEGNVVSSAPIYSSVPETAVPDSVGEAVLNNACGDWTSSTMKPVGDAVTAVKLARIVMANEQRRHN